MLGFGLVKSNYKELWFEFYSFELSSEFSCLGFKAIVKGKDFCFSV
jgi:hypothetical protein